MDNPGNYDLAVLEISAAMPQSLLIPSGGAVDLSGMKEVSLDFDFRYGTGGTSVAAIVATTFDGGSTWKHIARIDLTTASRAPGCTITKSALAVANYADLGSEGVNNGRLGDRLAVFLTVVGNYANSSLAVRASVS